jgi:hypothetical protein
MVGLRYLKNTHEEQRSLRTSRERKAMSYQLFIRPSREILDGIRVGDKIKINGGKHPLTVWRVNEKEGLLFAENEEATKLVSISKTAMGSGAFAYISDGVLFTIDRLQIERKKAEDEATQSEGKAKEGAQ